MENYYSINVLESLSNSRLIFPLLNSWKDDGFLLAGGAITQTIWNKQHGFSLEFGIEDLDIVYFDPDLSEKKEIARQTEFQARYPHCKLDVKNQARVHLWVKEKLGYAMAPYKCATDCIRTNLITATSIGLSLKDKKIYAPYGVEDIFNLKIRRNNFFSSDEQYAKKVQKWKSKWPNLEEV